MPIIEWNPCFSVRSVRVCSQTGSIDPILQDVNKKSEAAKSTIEKFDINIIGCKWMALFDDLSDRC